MFFPRIVISMVCTLSLAATNVWADDELNTSNMNDQPAATTPAVEQSSAVEVKINLNNATVKDLLKVKGINRTKAKNIIVYRKKNGDFKSLEDLKLVKGFKKLSPEQLKRLQDQLSVD